MRKTFHSTHTQLKKIMFFVEKKARMSFWNDIDNLEKYLYF